MAYAEAKHIDKNTIPVIDLSPLSKGEDGERFVGRQLLDIVQRLGFFYVENHGVPQAKIDLALETGAQVFRLDRAKKETGRVADYHRGFLPIGEATMSGASKPDNKESFIWSSWKCHERGSTFLQRTCWLVGARSADGQEWQRTVELNL